MIASPSALLPLSSSKFNLPLSEKGYTIAVFEFEILFLLLLCQVWPSAVVPVSHLLLLDQFKQVGKGAAVQIYYPETQSRQDVFNVTSRGQCLITFSTRMPLFLQFFPHPLFLSVALSFFSIFILFFLQVLRNRDFLSGLFSALSKRLHHLVWFYNSNEREAILWLWGVLMYEDPWIQLCEKEYTIIVQHIQPHQFDPSAHIRWIALLSSLCLMPEKEGWHS